MSTTFLCTACKALILGIFLLVVGIIIAFVGYFADQLSMLSVKELTGNSTIGIRNETKAFHLNNFSYVGPVIMGVGGFIVVASCVMTFEARDSAAKIVPARFRSHQSGAVNIRSIRPRTPRPSRRSRRLKKRRSTSAQTGGRNFRMYRTESEASGSDWSPKTDSAGKKAFTAAFVEFSRDLLRNASLQKNSSWRKKLNEFSLGKSPSAPNLVPESIPIPEFGRNVGRRLPPRNSWRARNRMRHESMRPLETISSNIFLRPPYLQRQALSVNDAFDETDEWYIPPMTLYRHNSRFFRGSRDSFDMELGSSAGVSGSQASMALDAHECKVTIEVQDERVKKRSEISRRHQLRRQKHVDEDVLPRCMYPPRFSCTPVEDRSARMKSSTSLKSPCYYSGDVELYASQGAIPKRMKYRSQSFSQTYVEPKRYEKPENAKIYCIDDHSEGIDKIEVYREEKKRSVRRYSPSDSPKSRVQEAGCFVHAEGSWVCGKVERKEAIVKIEEDQSDEEERASFRGRNFGRKSASFSTTSAPPYWRSAERGLSFMIPDEDPKKKAETKGKEDSE